MRYSQCISCTVGSHFTYKVYIKNSLKLYILKVVKKYVMIYNCIGQDGNIYKLLAYGYLNNLNKLGRYCDSHLKVVKSCVVTFSLKFKVVVYHTILIQVFTFLCVYINVLNYGCGSISHKFGRLVSGRIHTHVNCILRVY
jgi:hypothetical protein